EQNPKLIGDWGELVADQGENYDDYVLRNDVRVLAAGMRDSRRGLKHKQHRPSLWIIDDPDDAKTVGSEKVRTKQIHYVTRMVRPAVDPKVGRVFVIANETHPECMVAQIYRDGEKPPHEQRFGAWKKYRFNAIKEDGTPLWPERFPLEYLLSLKQEDPEGFETEYMNNPPSGTSRPFKKLNYYSRAELEKVKCPTVLVLDPALGRTRESDFQATLVLKYHKGRFLIWRAHLTRLPPPGLRRLFLDVYAAEQPDLAGIEDVGFQMLLAVLIDELGDAEGLFPSIRGIQQHTAKELRILSLVPLNDRGLLCFPDDGSCVELERQFLAYPDGKRDGPDVTEMGVRLLRLGLGGSGYLEVRHIARHSAFAHPDPDNLENSGIKARSRGGW
ncbi:MAG TPA: hypothetical protein PKW90_18420, partial [Myxococcota bacterium]|nr:hypothetical protein [Myxococcota bacterium]